MEVDLLKKLCRDDDHRQQYAALEAEPASLFGWYKWQFSIGSDIDILGSGIGVIYYRLYVPEKKDSDRYPLVAVLGGNDDTNSILPDHNGYACAGSLYAHPFVQEKHPAYVMTFSIPVEVFVSYEAELKYIYECGEIIKAVTYACPDIDTDRIYGTGLSQGAGYVYELISVQPELLAAAFINAGTIVHTTWGELADFRSIASSPTNMYIWHGSKDIHINVNEAFRAFQLITQAGKTNVLLEIQDAGHTLPHVPDIREHDRWTEWMFGQRKSKAFISEPHLTEPGDRPKYKWSGWQIFDGRLDGWSRKYSDTESLESAGSYNWTLLKEKGKSVLQDDSDCTEPVLGSIRMPAEMSTCYDGLPGVTSVNLEKPVRVTAGGAIAFTLQAYTGNFGYDLERFKQEWDVDCAVIDGRICRFDITDRASSRPIYRPDSVGLTNGTGPNHRGSVGTDNALDGRQVYLLIGIPADAPEGRVRLAIRFTRKWENNNRTASYFHEAVFDVIKEVH